ncbi:hypothetical protein [Desulfosporosinus youngiae]|uniref:Uncharacterized protein n=1 Tax=Desulfosporosinus youngiae DSM 17734 TaxID=768710 RepID=H5Y2M6_9FIRM|nr:hypothetical protein [Desulfosporosinus youngiae]EHQ88289.1 hypothetical protein DesyoDRAFT_1119 [Desulfosporosinus youngiae DSM 17734]
MDDASKTEEEELQGAVRKIVREEIQKLRPIEIIGLNPASSDLEKRVAALEECIPKRLKTLKFDKEKFVKTIKENMLQHCCNLDVSEGSTIGDILQTIAYSFQEALEEL